MNVSAKLQGILKFISNKQTILLLISKILKKLLSVEVKFSRVKYLVTKYIMKRACDPSKTDNNSVHKFTRHNNNGN